MPTDYRFDELDLRIEAKRGDAVDGYTMTQQTLGGATCEQTSMCTGTCCSEYCQSFNC